MNMQSNYKPIGDYIQLIDNRNSDLAIKKLLGINIDKFFMPSVANIVDTDLSKYKIGINYISHRWHKEFRLQNPKMIAILLYHLLMMFLKLLIKMFYFLNI